MSRGLAITLKATICLALVAAGWYYIAPQQVGGPLAYTVTTGNSMEPLLHDGDLAIVKQQDIYGVGDAVAYRSHQLGRTVLHRIIGGEGELFVFKGDNNDFIDPEKVAQEDILGRLVVHIPKVGAGIRYLQTPFAMGVGALLIVASLGFFGVKKRRDDDSLPRHRRSKDRDADSTPVLRPVPRVAAPTRPKPSDARRTIQMVAAVAGMVTIALASMGTLTMLAPATRPVEQPVSYGHAGSLSYVTPAPEGPAYDGPNIGVEEPVFLRLVDKLEVAFDYRFASEAPHDVSSSGQLAARVGAQNGFVRTIPLATEESPTPNGVTMSAPLDLAGMKDLLRSVEKKTGVAQSFYTVTLLPQVDVEGTVAEQPFEETFAPEVQLRFDGLQLQPLPEAEGGAAFSSSQKGSLRATTMEPAAFKLARWTVTNEAAQRVAIFGGAVALVIFLVSMSVLIFALPSDEAAKIQARYSSLLVPVQEIPTGAYDTIEVPDMVTLTRLAHQFEELVLHYGSRRGHSYMVFHGGLLYRYRTNDTDQGSDLEYAIDEPLREASILG